MSNPSSLRSIRKHLMAATFAGVFLLGGLGAWAATMELAGAVIANGVLVVDTNVKKVQHPTGGVVAKINVRDGDHVHAGDVVIRMDDTATRANLAMVVKGLNELSARRARLEAERDDTETIIFPTNIELRGSDEEADHAAKGEERLFELRRAARTGQKAQLAKRLEQLQQEIVGLTGQTAAKTAEIALIKKELEGVRTLERQRLTTTERVTALEREQTRLDGERSSLIASTAQAQGKISEIELQIIQIDQDLRSEVARELSDVQAKIAELVEQRAKAEQDLRRIDVRAPQDGVVHQLSVHTVDGVVGAGELLMLIVPQNDELTAELKIMPRDIDQISIGQPAMLRLSAFNQRTTPELQGIVDRVSADLSHDERTGVSYYTIKISMPAAEIAHLKGLKLSPGMPVEAFVKTDDRTVLGYLTKPISDGIERAFREE